MLRLAIDVLANPYGVKVAPKPAHFGDVALNVSTTIVLTPTGTAQRVKNGALYIATPKLRIDE